MTLVSTLWPAGILYIGNDMSSTRIHQHPNASGPVYSVPCYILKMIKQAHYETPYLCPATIRRQPWKLVLNCIRTMLLSSYISPKQLLFVQRYLLVPCTRALEKKNVRTNPRHRDPITSFYAEYFDREVIPFSCNQCTSKEISHIHPLNPPMKFPPHLFSFPTRLLPLQPPSKSPPTPSTSQSTHPHPPPCPLPAARAAPPPSTSSTAAPHRHRNPPGSSSPAASSSPS